MVYLPSKRSIKGRADVQKAVRSANRYSYRTSSMAPRGYLLPGNSPSPLSSRSGSPIFPLASRMGAPNRAGSSGSLSSELSAIQNQIKALQGLVDERELSRAQKGLRTIDAQLKKWRIELRQLRAKRTELRHLLTEAQGDERDEERQARKEAKGVASFKIPDVSIRGIIPNASLRDMLGTPTDKNVAALMRQIQREGLTLPRVRTIANRNAWEGADYINSPQFERDMLQAQIPENQAGRLKARIMAEEMNEDRLKAEAKAANDAAAAWGKRTKEINDARDALKEQNIEAQLAYELAARERDFAKANPDDTIAQESFNTKLEKNFSIWRDPRSAVLSLWDKGIKHEAERKAKEILDPFNAQQGQKDKDAYQGIIDESLKAIQEARASQQGELRQSVGTGVTAMNAALKDANSTAEDLQSTLSEIPAELKLWAEQGLNLSQPLGPLWRTFAKDLEDVKAAIPKKRDAENLQFLSDATTEANNALRDFDQADWSESQKLAFQRDEQIGSLRQQIDGLKGTLTDSGMQQALSMLDALAAPWNRLISGTREQEGRDMLDPLRSQRIELNNQIGAARAGTRRPLTDAEALDWQWKLEDAQLTTPRTKGQAAQVERERAAVRALTIEWGNVSRAQEETGRSLDAVSGDFDTVWGDVLSGQKTFGAALRDGLNSTLQEMAGDIVRSQVRSFFADLLGSALFGALGGNKTAAATGSGSVSLRGGDNLGSGFGLRSKPLSFATGTDYLPRDGYIYAHKGEAVMAAADNRRLQNMLASQSSSSNSGTVVQNISYTHNGDIRTDNPTQYQEKLKQQAKQKSGPRVSMREQRRRAAAFVGGAKF